MTEMTIERTDVQGTARHQVRVSLREIRECAWRAMFSTGLSSGEAASAADIVASMELHEGNGLTTLVDHLLRPSPAGRPMRVHRDSITWIEDPADRGPLLLAPLAIDFAMAARQPVLIPSATMHAAYEWYSIQVSTPDHPGVSLSEIAPDGTSGGASTISDATLRRTVPVDKLTTVLPPPEQMSTAAGGLLICPLIERVHVGSQIVASTPDERERRRNDGLARGVTLDAKVWTAARRAARHFLVSEDDA